MPGRAGFELANADLEAAARPLSYRAQTRVFHDACGRDRSNTGQVFDLLPLPVSMREPSGAPPWIRTRTGRFLKPLPLPVGLEGRDAGPERARQDVRSRMRLPVGECTSPAR